MVDPLKNGPISMKFTLKVRLGEKISWAKFFSQWIIFKGTSPIGVFFSKTAQKPPITQYSKFLVCRSFMSTPTICASFIKIGYVLRAATIQGAKMDKNRSKHIKNTPIGEVTLNMIRLEKNFAQLIFSPTSLLVRILSKSVHF